MHLKLGRSRERKRRKPSPPCPHVWESHEEIDRLLESLKTAFVANRVTSVKTTSTMTRQTIETTEERSCSVTTPRAEGPNVQQLQQLAGDAVDLTNSEMGHLRRSEEQKWSEATRSKERSSAPAEEEDRIYYKSEVNIEHKHATHFPIRTIATTPTPSVGATSSPAEDHSASSQSTVVQKRKHVSVRDRAKLLQQKVEEDYNNLVMSQEESANETADCGDTRENRLPLRPEEIPGAVRVLPPMQVGNPSGSRRASILRGSSVDSAGFSPPLTLPKFPPFSRRAESQPPPPKYVPVRLVGDAGTVGPQRDEESTTGGGDRRKWLKKSGGEVLRFTRDSYRTSKSVQTATTKTDSFYLSHLHHQRGEKSEPDDSPAFSSALPSCTTSACSTIDRAFLSDMDGFSAPTAALLQDGAECPGLPTPAYAATDSEVDELTAAPHYARKHMRSRSSPEQRMMQGSTSATPNASSAKRPRDGYEADTDDTLARRRRRSVREMARCIQVGRSVLTPSLSFLRPDQL